MADAAAPRLEIVSVDVDGPAHVVLQRGGNRLEAHSQDGAGTPRAVALTTLDAIADSLPGSVTVALDELHHLEGRHDIVVVVLTVHVGGVPLPHVGSALTGSDPALATARATVAALNRRLEILGT